MQHTVVARYGAKMVRFGFALLVASLVTALIATLVQSQINIADLRALGQTVSAPARVELSLDDLIRFGPIMMVIAAVGLLPATAVARLISSTGDRRRRRMLMAVAGVAGLWLTFLLLGLVTPMRALVSATRGAMGLWSVCASGAVGAIVYDRLCGRTVAADPRRSTTLAPRLVTSLLIGVVVAASFLLSAPRAAKWAQLADPASYHVQVVLTGLNRPWSLAFVPDGPILVTEMSGRLLALSPAGERSEIDIDALPQVYHPGPSAGLMEVMLDPDFASNQFVYLTMAYGDAQGNGTRVVRGRLQGKRLQDVQVLFESTRKTGQGNNGGRMAFLPDGTFVLTVGDGSDWREQAQDRTCHQGKTVRLDRNGRSPSDNPFADEGSVAYGLYSSGHRNAQGIAYDAVNDRLVSTEHGARGGDEVNLIAAGRNYGWPLVTDGIDYSFARVTPFVSLPGYEAAVLQWTPSIAPAGLAIYDAALFAGWQGSWLVPTLKERSLRRVQLGVDGTMTQQLLLTERRQRLRDVKVAPDGTIYVLTDGRDAELLRLLPVFGR